MVSIRECIKAAKNGCSSFSYPWYLCVSGIADIWDSIRPKPIEIFIVDNDDSGHLEHMSRLISATCKSVSYKGSNINIAGLIPPSRVEITTRHVSFNSLKEALKSIIETQSDKKHSRSRYGKDIFKEQADLTLINLAMGVPTTNQNLTGWQDFIRYVCDKNILIVVAVGNERSTLEKDKLGHKGWYPALMTRDLCQSDPLLRVGATGIYHSLAEISLLDDSNRGRDFVDILAPGKEILVLTEEPRYIHGTSPATAITTGAIGWLLRCDTSATREKIRNTLLASAHKIPALQNDVLDGNVLNIKSAIDELCKKVDNYTPVQPTSINAHLMLRALNIVLSIGSAKVFCNLGHNLSALSFFAKELIQHQSIIDHFPNTFKKDAWIGLYVFSMAIVIGLPINFYSKICFILSLTIQPCIRLFKEDSDLVIKNEKFDSLTDMIEGCWEAILLHTVIRSTSDYAFKSVSNIPMNMIGADALVNLFIQGGSYYTNNIKYHQPTTYEYINEHYMCYITLGIFTIASIWSMFKANYDIKTKYVKHAFIALNSVVLIDQLTQVGLLYSEEGPTVLPEESTKKIVGTTDDYLINLSQEP